MKSLSVSALAMTLALVAGLSTSPLANAGRPSPPVNGMSQPSQERFSIPLADIPGIELQIQEVLKAGSGFQNLRDFRVDWSPSSLRCLKVVSEMDYEVQLGACTVHAGAFQVEASVAIIKSTDGYAVHPIYVNVD